MIARGRKFWSFGSNATHPGWDRRWHRAWTTSHGVGRRSKRQPKPVWLAQRELSTIASAANDAAMPMASRVPSSSASLSPWVRPNTSATSALPVVAPQDATSTACRCRRLPDRAAHWQSSGDCRGIGKAKPEPQTPGARQVRLRWLRRHQQHQQQSSRHHRQPKASQQSRRMRRQTPGDRRHTTTTAGQGVISSRSRIGDSPPTDWK